MRKNQAIILILFTAMNLRLAVTAITPLFTAIQSSFQVGSSVTALLVTLPLLCFAGGAILVPRLQRIWGRKSLLVLATGLLMIANLIRPNNLFLLLSGTVLIGLAIALLNVLIPVMVAQAATSNLMAVRLTSYYAVVMNLMATLGTALVTPLTSWLGWQTVLRLFAIPALLALIVSLKSPATPAAPKTPATPHTNGLWATLRHDQAARNLTLFMGLQSLIFYSLIAWLPAIFHSLGATASEAGLLAAVFQLVGIPAALVLNLITKQRHVMGIIATGYLAGSLCLFGSHWGWWLAAGILGFTCSLIFSTALTLIATSGSEPTQIASYSALAQSLGYLLAAVGPVTLGRLHDLTHRWQPVLECLMVLMAVTVYLGFRVLHHRRD